VELAGVEPASKQGIFVLSTRLSWPLFSSGSKTQATNYRLICLIFAIASQPAKAILRIPAPLDPSARRHGLERRPVQVPCTRMMLIYYTSIRQREHKKCCQLLFEDDIYERIPNARRAYTTTLPAVKTR